MIDAFYTKLPQSLVNNCIIKLNDLECGIIDSPDSCCVLDNVNYHTKISNPNLKDFYFIAIYKCSLDETFKGKRCDFGILIENEKLILVEIKETSFPKYRKSRPILQLENTISHFSNQGLVQLFTSHLAIVSWGYKPIRGLVNSSFNTAKLRFKLLYNFDLKEGNLIEI